MRYNSIRVSEKRIHGHAQRNEFVRIANEIRGRIEAGDIEKGRFLPTEREIQSEFGVSRSTVRRAISRLTDEGWLQSVPNRGVIASSGYSPKRTANIAILDGSSYVLRLLVRRFSSMLSDRGMHLVHLHTPGNVRMEEPLQYVAENFFSGAIVWPYRGFVELDEIRKISTSLPLVFLDHLPHRLVADLVTFDYLKASEEATCHLIRQGAKRVAVTGMLDMLTTTHDRFSGYMKGLFECGLQPQARDFIFNHTSGMTSVDTYNLERRLRDTDRPDGLFIMQDEFVPQTVEAVLRCGLRIPEDIKIVTIGDEVDLTVNGVGLTTIAPDWDAMAHNAVELLLDRISDPIRSSKTVHAPHKLIVRGLCGASQAEWTPDPDKETGFHGDFPVPRSQYRYSTLWSAEHVDSDSHLH